MADPDMKPVYSDFYVFLDKHYKYLNEIADLISMSATGEAIATTSQINQELSKKLTFSDEWVQTRSIQDKGLQGSAIRHLQNAWFNECALHYPFETDQFLERMRFAPWKITQFYYTIYSGLSSMIRFVNSKSKLSHRESLNFFVCSIVADSKLCTRLFPLPFCFFLNRGILYPDPDHVSLSDDYRKHLRGILAETKDALPMGELVGMVHYFRWLREWFNYDVAYVFANFYGKILKAKMDDDLMAISNAFFISVEKFAIGFLGKDRFQQIYGNFRKMLTSSLDLTPTFIDERMALY